MREEKKYYLFKNAPLLAEADVVVIGGGQQEWRQPKRLHDLAFEYC